MRRAIMFGGWPATRKLRALRRVLALGTACLLLSAASAAAASAPRPALRQAAGMVTALSRTTTSGLVRVPAAATARELGAATAPEFWIDSQHVVAPAYGETVFADGRVALQDLALLSRRGAPQTAAVQLILGADRGLAEGSVAQARGGSKGLLGAARRTIVVADRERASGQAGSAAAAYAHAWGLGFQALTGLVADKVTHVPAGDLAAAAQLALGSKKIGLAGPRIFTGAPLMTAQGKPELFFGGSEACPFCAVERWGMIAALAQFGRFSNLHLMQSDTTESPEIRTLTFFGSRYRSTYISFVPVEVWSNVRRGFGFAHLQKPTPFEQGLINTFDPTAETPFIDVAGRYVKSHSTVAPQRLRQMSWGQIADSLVHPRRIATQAIAGEAEVLTAELCEVTGGTPQSVCASPVVKEYQAGLAFMNGKGGGCVTTSAQAAAVALKDPPAWGASRCHT